MNFETAFQNYLAAELAEQQAIETDTGGGAYDIARAALDGAHADLMRAPITSVRDASTLFDLLWTHHTPDDTDDALNTVGASELIDRMRVVMRQLAAKPMSSVGRIGRA